jgi:hypothetical protein
MTLNVNKNDFVPARYEPTMEAFSRQRKYQPVGQRDVACIKAGAGEPHFLLHD